MTLLIKHFITFFSLLTIFNTYADDEKIALKQLIELGAKIEQVNDHMGNSGVMITIGNLWIGKDDDLRLLTRVENLYKLRLSGHISDDGMEFIKNLHDIKSLDLHLLSLTDVGVSKLRGLIQLQRLNLTYTQTTDAGIAELTSLKALKWLGLAYTRVTKKGLNKLKEALPNTIIQGRFI